MGMFDRVMVDCPNCGERVEFQSKAGECVLADFGVNDAPVPVLMDIMNIPEHCDCGAWLAVIDPRAPGSFVRPEAEVVRVKEPHQPGFNGYQFVWPDDLDFTKDDIEENN